MKIIVCVWLLLFCNAVKAQYEYRPLLPFADSSYKGVLKLAPPKLIYKGNSRHFDIYSAAPDNMIVIKPDSTIHFKMPTGRYNSIKTPVRKPGER